MKKNILLIMPDFFGYTSLIKKEFESREYNVHFLKYDPPNTFFNKICKKIFKKRYRKIIDNYYFSELKSLSSITFEKVILVYGGIFFSKTIFDFIKKMNPNSEFIFYNRDSIENCKNIFSFYEMFDRRYSFDLHDCQKYNFAFLPLFKENTVYTNNCEKRDICVSIFSFSISKANDYIKLRKLVKKHLTLIEYIYLHSVLNFYFLKMTHPIKMKEFKKSDFIYKPIKYDDAMDILANSKFVLDCPLQGQNGLTIRTYESLSRQTKIITTNFSIKKYPFYNNNNIYIYGDLQNDKYFFKSNFNKESVIPYEYNINVFTDVILGIANKVNYKIKYD